MPYRPEQILVEKEALKYPFCQSILKKWKNTPQTIVDKESGSPFFENDISLTKGKRILYLKEFKGNAFKLCPGFSDSVLCCNYYVIDLIENCPLECSYCILQAFLNKPIITFHVNVETIIEKMIEEIKANPTKQYRIGTGEHSDSLALDHIFGVNPFLVKCFSNLPNATLELKTKTNAISSLKGLKHNKRTVVAWSLNPTEIIASNEFRTATLEERLKAAGEIQREGYKVAFHFDPLIYYKEWKSGYKRTIEQLFEAVPAKDIAWISLGTLRYIPKLKQIAEERFPKTGIFSNEFIPAEDGKMRYIKPIRKRMLSYISGWIQEKAPIVPLYLCMERHSTWSKLFSCSPQNPSELERYLNSQLDWN